MKVLKFGGTSVGTPESLQCVKSIVESQPEPCIVTVSALGGITNRLIECGNRAANADTSFNDIILEIRNRHNNVIDCVLSEELVPECKQEVSSLIDELEMVCNAVYLLRELTPRSLDLIESYGERMSCIIVSMMISGAVLRNSLDFIRTHQQFGKSVLDPDTTSALIRETFSPLKDEKIIVVPGFISKDNEGRITNLGRGGSDYTAAILAAELNASVLEIWTDVDGFMTADPRVVKDACVIDSLSFVEAMELCNFGAKVVYPPTIYPVFSANIPILIKNTFNSSAKGTLIAESQSRRGIIGVSAIAGTCLVSLSGAPGEWSDRMINALSRNGVETFMPNDRCQCAIHEADSARALEILNGKFAEELASGAVQIEITHDLSTIAIIGPVTEQLLDNATDQFAAALNCQGIPVTYSPRRASPGAVACMVPHSFLKQSLNAIHNTFIIKQ